MDLVLQYILFLSKTITMIFSLMIFILFIMYISKKNYNINMKLKNVSLNYRRTINKILDIQLEVQSNKLNIQKPKLYILHFQGGMNPSREISYLSKFISIIISIAKPYDQVLLKLESAGGSVHEYGLAAAQLQRLRKHKIKLIVSVDKIAASGGYMMACVANKIFAAPFAILGSIGVVSQFPNFHRWLKKNDIDLELYTAGNYKRTLTMFGENKEHHRIHFQKQLNIVHTLFKNFIQEMRPGINIDSVSDGDYFFGNIALEKKLIDEICTSDEIILTKMKKYNVISISSMKSKNFFRKFINKFVGTLMSHFKK